METAWHTRRRCRELNNPVPHVWAALRRRACALAVLLLLLCGARATQAADGYAGRVDYMAHSPPVIQPPAESNSVILEGLLILAVVVLASRIVAKSLGRRVNTSIQRTAEQRQPLDY